MLRAVELRPARVLLVPERHHPVCEHLSVTFFVLTEEAGSEVIAAPVPLAEFGLNLQFHQGIPLRWSRLWPTSLTMRFAWLTSPITATP
jgi:hypothetical protein